MPQGKVSRPSTTVTQPAKKPAKTNSQKKPAGQKKPAVKPQAQSNKLVIVKQEIGNTGYDCNDILTDYGGPLYANNLRYVRQKIYYEGLSSGQTKTIYIRIIDPSGKIKTGKNSPAGYTWQESIEFKPGRNWFTTLGWGRGDKSNYTPGRYISEMWMDGVCVSSVTFEVH